MVVPVAALMAMNGLPDERLTSYGAKAMTVAVAAQMCQRMGTPRPRGRQPRPLKSLKTPFQALDIDTLPCGPD